MSRQNEDGTMNSQSKCEQMQMDMDAMVEGQLDSATRAQIEAHVAMCDECRGQLEIINALREERPPQPEQRSFDGVRRNVIEQLRREAKESRGSLLDRIGAMLRVPAFAMALMGVGVAAGLLIPRMFDRTVTPPAEPVVASSTDGGIVQEISLAASKHRQLEDIENSPYTYSNVQIRESGAARVQLSFDVARHVDVTLPKNDPLLTEVLVQSLLTNESVGTRLKAVEYSGNVLEPRVRETLIRTMLADENLAVRLQAQTKLAVQSGDAEIMRSMLAVLQGEVSVPMRLAAIDYLTTSRIEPERLRTAIDAGPGDAKAAVIQRASLYLDQRVEK